MPPPDGTLDFDYVSAKRPDPNQAPIDLPNFARMLQPLGQQQLPIKWSWA